MPYIGEIRLFAGTFQPLNWPFCNGQLLQIADAGSLFNLIGTTYGGDGQTTVGVPNLCGRVPLHQGTDTWGNVYTLAETGGVETVVLSTPQLPGHTHALSVSSALTNTSSPANAIPAQAVTATYGLPGSVASFNPQSVQAAGGSQPHDNLQPYLALNFIISLAGAFPAVGPSATEDATPLVGEVRAFAFSSLPGSGWLACNGQLLPIAANTQLFSILGTTYGGDGKTTFGVPNLQGVVPLGAGSAPSLSSYAVGDTGGFPTIQLLQTEMPVHQHSLAAGLTDAHEVIPSRQTIFVQAVNNAYAATQPPSVSLNPNALSAAGGDQPHNNLQPYLALNLAIATQGIFPSRGAVA